MNSKTLLFLIMIFIVFFFGAMKAADISVCYSLPRITICGRVKMFAKICKDFCLP